jgi:hypothetical protein
MNYLIATIILGFVICAEFIILISIMLLKIGGL